MSVTGKEDMSRMGEEDLGKYPDRINELFRDKTILITGGTGFLGKVFVEKLLRCCSGLKKVFILVRTKKDKDPQQRLREIFNGPLYEMLRKRHGNDIFKKVEAISADMGAPDLDLSAEDRQRLINETDMIYHIAATIRFDQDLQTATFLNVRGTKLMLDLAKECRKLLIFCHLSTAYCHLNERILYEKAYPPPTNPMHVIKACEWMNKATINKIQNDILGDIPNTYSFTKALAEDLINNEMDNLPTIILRPSVVIPIWKEPIPGWTDNLNGPTGLLIGAGKGVLRTMYCKGETYSDYVPVDIVANAILCTTFDYLTLNKRRIYNITSSAEYQISFDQLIEIGRDIVSTRLPLNWVLWYPGGNMHRYRILHYLAFFFYQLLPALFIDAFLLVLGVKPILTRVQRRIWKGYEVLEYYANRQWDFNSDGTMEARKIFNPREQSTYVVNGDGMDYYDYFTDCTHAARLYLLKETDDTIKTAKRHMTIMWYVDKFFKILILAGFLYLFWKKVVVSFNF